MKMKKIGFSIAFIILSFQSFAQCFEDRHSASWFDHWISCETAESPNEIRGKSHWIEYDFNTLYALEDLKIWNINDPDLINFGAKMVIIDYSEDGINWVEYGDATFPIAPGVNTYEGDDILNFNGLKARKLLLTIEENYGGDCFGFGELRIGVDSTQSGEDDICISAAIFPNPFGDNLNITLKEKCLENVFVGIENVLGKTVNSEIKIELYEQKIINTADLSPGIYYVCFRSGEFKKRYKIVKR